MTVTPEEIADAMIGEATELKYVETAEFDGRKGVRLLPRGQLMLHTLALLADPAELAGLAVAATEVERMDVRED